jgi:L-iditol 2-dehydrogenase
MFTRLLRLEGARVLATDLFPERLRLARRFGAMWTAKANPKSKIQNPKSRSPLTGHASRITKGRGLDAAVIAVPSDAVAREAQALLRGGGQLLLFAHTKRGDTLALDPAAVCVDEKDLLGSYSSDFTLQAEVARLVFSRRLDVRRLITHRFPLAQTAAAVAMASRPRPESLKVVVSLEWSVKTDLLGQSARRIMCA